jgi:NAD-dependent deacetylase
MRQVNPGVVVLTGAGVSADSGLATFRGAGGLWESRRIEDVATVEAWRRDPAGVWSFYQLRRARLSTVEPNDAHRALARLSAELREAGVPFHLVTQNVDDLHERAGSDPIHMHGELAVLLCERCGSRRRDLDNIQPECFVPCPDCGWERMRPDVVWFGEMPYHLEEIDAALGSCTHFVAVGTSGAVYPAAGYLDAARAAGAQTVVQSLDEPLNVHPSDRFVPGRAAEVVPGLVEELLTDLGVS